MSAINMTGYQLRVRERSWWRYVLGLGARWLTWLRIQRKLRMMRQRGAVVGSHIGIAKAVTPPASKFLVIGDHVSIHTEKIDVRAPLRIGNNVIIGDSASIITCSHNIDSPEWELKTYGLEIEDYVWLATNAMILPSCRKIGRGAVVGAGAVVVKDVPPMAVISGNPAQIIRYRKCVHENLCVESLLGGDLMAYREARKGI